MGTGMRRCERLPWLRRGAQGLVGCGLALALAGCFGSSSSSSNTGDPASALPANTLLYAQVYVRPSGPLAASFDAASERLLGIADPGPKLDALLDKALAEDAPAGVSYETDLRPWLGRQAGIALLSGPSAAHPLVVAVVDQTNSAKAAALADNRALFANKGAAPDKTTAGSYRGFHYTEDLSQHIDIGVVGGFLVLGSPAAFDAVVDVNKGAASLATVGAYKQAISVALRGSDAVVYLPFAKLASLLTSEVEQADPGLSAQGATDLGSFAHSILVGSVRLNAQGAALDLAIADATATPASGETNPIGDLPAGSWLALGATNVGPVLEKSITAALAELNNLEKITTAATDADLSTVDATASLQQSLAQIQKETGLNVEADLGAITTTGLFAEGTSLDTLEAALVLGVKSSASAPRIVGQLRSLAEYLERSSKSFTVGKLTFPGVDAGFTIVVPKVPFAFDIAASGDRIVAALGVTSLSDALASSGRLAGSPGYTAASSLLGSDVKPVLILELPQLVTLLDSFGAGNSASASKILGYIQHLGTIAVGDGRSGIATHVRIVVSGR